MTLATFRNKVDLNPELEALRAKGLKESCQDINDLILQLIYRTSRIHAGFLFEDLKTLQNLCLFIGETQNKITDAGWEAFGYHLGLSPSILKVIKYNNFNKEDPCYNVLLAYVQNENASIGKIIQALKDLGRIDVLSRVQDSIKSLADIIYQCNVNSDSANSLEETSDYESLTSSEGNSNSNGNSSSNIIEPLHDVLLKPAVIPPAPFIFQNIQATPRFTSQQIQSALNNIVLNSFSNNDKSKINHNINNKINCIDSYIENHKINLVKEGFQCQDILSYEKKSYVAPKKEKYGIKILLTFVEDGKKYAEEVCKILRRKRDNYPKIGVLVLAEHAGTVNKDPQQFISGAFSQVDYVCPILTSGYFNLISKKQKVSSISNMHIDALYAAYIFHLMNSYFISNDCLNDKVRSIIPDDEFSLIPVGNLWANPVLGAWVRLSEVDDLAIRLLRNKKNT